MAKLYFRYGAMGSSKSANILMVHHNYKERGQYAVLLKPRIDNRDGEHKIASRIGLSAPADYVEDFLKEVSKTWRIKEGDRKEYTRCEKKNEVDKKYLYHGKRVDAILVDEAQFLSEKDVDALSDIVDFCNIPVLCYGLRTDFQSHLFTGSKRLLEIADEKANKLCQVLMKAMQHFVENITKKESYGISFDVLALSSISSARKAKPALA